ncbi:MAG: hypothetical protein P8J14_11810 [Emcibacteraceae bacterium]|nr:hypothetical protein [Emcibacteraceae bacterium]
MTQMMLILIISYRSMKFIFLAVLSGHSRKKRAFANDLSKGSPLRVVHRWTNRIPKNADDPSEYSPSWVPGRCQYLKDWISIKQTWGLSMDKIEAASITKQLKACD